MAADPHKIEEERRATALAEATRVAGPAETPEVTTRRAREFYRFLSEPEKAERASLTGSRSEPGDEQ